MTKQRGAVMRVTGFCVPGAHEADGYCEVREGKRVGLPHGWKFVRARSVCGVWYEDPSSSAQVLCCPLHAPMKLVREEASDE